MAAEMAALWPESVRRLALIAPFGLFDAANPPTDPWAQRGDAVPGLMCADPEIWKAMKELPEGANSVEWPIEQTRANEAAARIFWPLGNTRLEKRLKLIQAPTLLVWGEQDRVMPRSYAETFAKGIVKIRCFAVMRPPWPNDHICLPRRLVRCRTAKNRNAAAVRCSAWFGVTPRHR